MRRRDFIKSIGGAVSLPLAQHDRMWGLPVSFKIKSSSSGAFDPAAAIDPNWFNAAANRLPIFKAAVAQTLAGVADTIISNGGDSTSKGYDSSSFYTTYPSVLASLLSAAGYPSQAESRFSAPAPLSADAQLSIGSGWGNNLASAGGMMWNNSTTANPVVFTTPITITSFDLYYYDLAGSFQVTVDGTAVDTITTGGTDATIKKTYSVASGTHALGIVRTAGNFSFMGWTIRNSASKKIIINNLGSAGTTSGTWQPAGSYNPQAVLKLTAPHLTIINLGINDGVFGTAPATFLSNIQTLINSVAPASDVLLMYFVPTSPANVPIATQQAIGAEIYALAASNNFIGLDMTKRWVSWSNVSAAFYGNDPLHPNDVGYSDEATALAAILEYCARN